MNKELGEKTAKPIDQDGTELICSRLGDFSDDTDTNDAQNNC